MKMFSPTESCSRIREFQTKMQEDLCLLAIAMEWPPEQTEKEADRAMLLMLEWEAEQNATHPLTRTARK